MVVFGVNVRHARNPFRSDPKFTKHASSFGSTRSTTPCRCFPLLFGRGRFNLERIELSILEKGDPVFLRVNGMISMVVFMSFRFSRDV